MTRHRGAATIQCPICKQQRKSGDFVSGELVRSPIVELIRQDHPEWSPTDLICLPDLSRYRGQYVEDMLELEKGELSSLEQEVVRSVQEQEVLSENINETFERQLTFGEHIADKVAEFGGSWRFILSFGGVLVVWIIVNSIALLRQPFDPYPFILLNLVLSCLAALQAPIIMMSQNRQEARDRLRAENDYVINLKAELEIRNLTAKMDQLLAHQWQRLLEIQELQMQTMEELMRKVSHGK